MTRDRRINAESDLYQDGMILHEALEPRLMLSGTTYLVDSLADVVGADPAATDGVVTLREAIEAANTNAPFGDAAAGSGTETDVIQFDPALTATNRVAIATTGPLVIQDDVEIIGPGSALLTLDAGGGPRVLEIDAGVSAVVSGLTLTGGANSEGAGLRNAGNTVLQDVAVIGNTGRDPSRPFLPSYNGGGIYNDAGAWLEIID